MHIQQRWSKITRTKALSNAFVRLETKARYRSAAWILIGARLQELCLSPSPTVTPGSARRGGGGRRCAAGVAAPGGVAAPDGAALAAAHAGPPRDARRAAGAHPLALAAAQLVPTSAL